jgi:hypothetical protein
MKKTFLRAVALAAVLSFAVVNVSFATGGSVGHGNISVFKDGQLTTKLSGQNPIEDGAMLMCDGKCMIKSEGISLIGTDKSQIAVGNEVDTFNLYMKEGKVGYAINSNARTIAFHTPQGTYTVAEAVFNDSGNPVVKGDVVVNDEGSTEIAVTEGRLVFATADGMKTVDANNKIVLAVTPGIGGVSPLLIGGLAAAALVTTIVVVDNNDDDDDTVAAATTTTTSTSSTSSTPTSGTTTTTTASTSPFPGPTASPSM